MNGAGVEIFAAFLLWMSAILIIFLMAEGIWRLFCWLIDREHGR